MRRAKRRRFARAAGIIVWLIIGFILFHLIVACAPFVVLPAIDPQTAAELDAQVEEMMRDTDCGDRAMLLTTGLSALDERLRLIAGAQEEIIIVTYECHDGESTRDILAAALSRADAGVRVRFLVDGIAGRLDHMRKDLFCAAAAHPNVEIRFYNLISQLTPWKHLGRMHEKYVIVDDTAYILGGRNMFDKFLGDYPSPQRSLDREVLVWNAAGSAESSLYALREYFEAMWAGKHTSVFSGEDRIDARQRESVYVEMRERWSGIVKAKPGLFAPRDRTGETVATRGIWLIGNPTRIYAKKPTAFYQLLELIRRADEDVILHSPYAVLTRRMRGELAKAAQEVPVTLMVNAVENGLNVVASSDYLYHRGSVLSTGVQLLEYAGGISCHGKTAVIDGDISVISSFNLDPRSAYIDTELMLVIRSPELNAELRAQMEALHADCRRVTPAGESVPAGLTVPEMTFVKRAALYLLGALLQPVRSLI